MTARTADEAVALALSLVGRTEQPTNSNRLPLPEGGTLWSAVGLAGYDKDRASWCGGFVQYVLGAEASGIPAATMAYTPAAIAAYRGRGWAVTSPQPGDLVWFNFSGGRTPEHVGLVLAVNKDGSIISVEGNTSPGDAGSQSNGGGVYRRIRPVRYVVGYGRPRYAQPTPKELRIVVNAAPVAVLTHTSWGSGYIIVMADGGVATFGGAPFFGSLGDVKLDAPIVAAAVTPSGQGYKLLGRDGGVFDFGDSVGAGRVEYSGS